MSSVELKMGNIEEFFADPIGPIGRIIEEKSIETEAMAKALLMLPGQGRLYLPGVIAFTGSTGKFYTNWATGGRTSAHVASAPAEPPASDTGLLLASIGHRIGTDGTVYGIVGSPSLVAVYMELGTHRVGGEVGNLPRPFLVPALEIVVGPAIPQ